MEEAFSRESKLQHEAARPHRNTASWSRVQLAGLYMLARSIDKMRARLPGGELGVYVTERGRTKVLLDMLGVTHEQFRDAVASARSDDDVVRWLRERADVSQYSEINDRPTRWTLADNPPERWDYVDTLYPNRSAGHAKP